MNANIKHAAVTSTTIWSTKLRKHVYIYIYKRKKNQKNNYTFEHKLELLSLSQRMKVHVYNEEFFFADFKLHTATATTTTTMFCRCFFSSCEWQTNGWAESDINICTLGSGTAVLLGACVSVGKSGDTFVVVVVGGRNWLLRIKSGRWGEIALSRKRRERIVVLVCITT